MLRLQNITSGRMTGIEGGRNQEPELLTIDLISYSADLPIA